MLRRLMYLGVLLLVLLQGAAAEAARPARDAPAQPEVVVLHLPGIAGLMPMDKFFLAGLSDAGFADHAELLNWPGEERGLRALGDAAVHREATRKAIERIVMLRREFPNAQLILTGHSAGAGIAAFALEKLPAGVTVDQLVLIAPALSPGYDLSAALAKVEGQSYAYISEFDKFVLGPGTRVFGTVDRVRGDAAGLVGFDVPPERAEAYKRLMQIPYDAAWLRLGNLGDHIGAMGYQFTREVTVPLLRTGKLPPPPTTQPERAKAP